MGPMGHVEYTVIPISMPPVDVYTYTGSHTCTIEPAVAWQCETATNIMRPIKGSTAEIPIDGDGPWAVRYQGDNYVYDLVHQARYDSVDHWLDWCDSTAADTHP